MLALTLGIVPLVGAQIGNVQWMNMARTTSVGLFVFIAIAFACLAYSFLNDDFSVTYIAMHSNSHMPVQYKFAGIWGGHEGSLLLWVLFLSVWTVSVTIFSRHLPLDMVARVLSVLGLVAVGFISFMVFTSNPFERVLPGPMDGQDLNPLLQDFGLVIHPPMLYMGYVGFSVAFAFALAALMGGKLDSTWVRWTRPWTTIAWMFLSVGIALGSWWAYYELGWGGWWFWDPVENASFMPWLAGTALIHSLAVTEKRGSFRSWSVLLAILAFSLSLLGTFLVRSGVLTSVHSFAADPERGLFILIFLLIVVGGSLLLYALRASTVFGGGMFHSLSKETAILSGNVLLVVACAVVLMGTLAPILYEAFDKNISVGPPFFNLFFVPLAVTAAILMGIGPVAYWKKADPLAIAKQLRVPLVAAIATAIVIVLFDGEAFNPYVLAGSFAAFWIIYATLLNFVTRISMLSEKGPVKNRMIQIPSSFYGMCFGHIGLAVSIIGITMVSNYQVERDVRMDIGDTLSIHDYTFRFINMEKVSGPNYDADRGYFTVTRGGDAVTVLTPEKRIYRAQRRPMTEAGIYTSIFRDLYVSLGDPLNKKGTSWSVRVYYKPFVVWIWSGSLFMAIAGGFVLSDRRYRVGRKAKKFAVRSLAASTTG